MNAIEPRTPRPHSESGDIRSALAFAGTMLLIPVAARLAAQAGWTQAGDLSQRAFYAVLGGFIAVLGNDIPKRHLARACANADPGRVQSFYRFAGWAWVISGFTLAAAAFLAPVEAVLPAFLVFPAAMAAIVIRWLGLRSSGGPTS